MSKRATHGEIQYTELPGGREGLLIEVGGTTLALVVRRRPGRPAEEIEIAAAKFFGTEAAARAAVARKGDQLAAADGATRSPDSGADPEDAPPGPCPTCGAELFLKNWRGGAFYGCTNFPRCKGSRDLDGTPRGVRPAADPPFESLPDTGDDCADCGEPQRRSPGGPVCRNGHGGAESRPRVRAARGGALGHAGTRTALAAHFLAVQDKHHGHEDPDDRYEEP